MHELALIEELCALALEAASEQGARTIHALRVRIGDQAGVNADALRQAFAIVTLQSPWRETTLDLEVVTTRCFCSNCSEAFAPLDVIHHCPRCGALSSEVIAGRELELVSMEVS